ncbi:MAG: hydroxyacid dehydrogenase [Phycisphaerales bacterium]|nr:hydroxyacid dehydrogenase [Phycisphaerales bacterium]
MLDQKLKKTESGCASSGSSTLVLLADAFRSESVVELEVLGCQTELQPSLSGDELVAAISKKKPDILVVRSTKVTAEMMDASERLSVIIRAGAGYDTIDVEAASARGISVSNCPGKNSVAVAELAWGLILSCDRRIPDQVADLRSGQWDKKGYSKSSGLFGRTIGIVGLGQIGLEVVKRAKTFGMHVVAWSRSLTEEKAEQLGIEYCEKLQDIAPLSDVVSIHVSSTPETEKFINANFLDAMKENAIIVNTSRGKVVDEGALAIAIKEKHLRVGLDVFENEPSSGDTTFSSSIVNEPHVYGTHHVGASTDQAQESIASEVVKIITTFIKEGRAVNCVNQVVEASAPALLSIRHKNLPGVLAHVLDELSISGVNIEEMENVLYEGSQAACARMQLGTIPNSELINNIKSNENIFSVTLTTQI